jgi:hypothetical protein
MTSLSIGCMTYLYICLYTQLEVLQMSCCLRAVHALRKRIVFQAVPPSVGCSAAHTSRTAGVSAWRPVLSPSSELGGGHDDLCVGLPPSLPVAMTGSPRASTRTRLPQVVPHDLQTRSHAVTISRSSRHPTHRCLRLAFPRGLDAMVSISATPPLTLLARTVHRRPTCARSVAAHAPGAPLATQTTSGSASPLSVVGRRNGRSVGSHVLVLKRGLIV